MPLLGTRRAGWNGYRLTGIVIVVVGQPIISESSGLAASKEKGSLMQGSADVVIIGGGVMGASTAYHLAVRGCTNVVLLEARTLAAVGTGHSGSIVRQHYSQDVTTLLALRSVEMFENFEELTGRSGVFHQTGWLKLGPPDVVGAMDDNSSRHRELGVDVEEVPLEDLPNYVPGINTDGLGAALFEPRSGYADPVATTQGFASRAQQLGVAIHEGTPATGVTIAGDRVTGVETSAGRISAPVVVNATGPWSGVVASWAGIEIPITVTREQDILLRCEDAAVMPKMAVSNGVDCIYWRPAGDGLLLAGDGYPKDIETADPDNYNTDADDSFKAGMMERLGHRLPTLTARSEIVRSYASLYDVSPDWHPIIGNDPAVGGFVHCEGFSGHGFKLGPAVGKVVAETILDGRASTVDISPFRLERFAEGALLAGSYAGNQA